MCSRTSRQFNASRIACVGKGIPLLQMPIFEIVNRVFFLLVGSILINFVDSSKVSICRRFFSLMPRFGKHVDPFFHAHLLCLAFCRSSVFVQREFRTGVSLITNARTIAKWHETFLPQFIKEPFSIDLAVVFLALPVFIHEPKVRRPIQTSYQTWYIEILKMIFEVSYLSRADRVIGVCVLTIIISFCPDAYPF